MGIKRVSGVKLAAACNVSQNYLSKRLRGEFPFTLNDVEQIAEALELDYLTLVIPPSRRFDERRGA
jgi:transcriptional regulator with XRE-family HTH domain